jgi:hypothetical protein
MIVTRVNDELSPCSRPCSSTTQLPLSRLIAPVDIPSDEADGRQLYVV